MGARMERARRSAPAAGDHGRGTARCNLLGEGSLVPHLGQPADSQRPRAPRPTRISARGRASTTRGSRSRPTRSGLRRRNKSTFERDNGTPRGENRCDCFEIEARLVECPLWVQVRTFSRGAAWPDSALTQSTLPSKGCQPSGCSISTCPSHLFHLWQKPWNFASPPDTLSGMHKIIEIFADRAALHTEILALRQQVVPSIYSIVPPNDGSALRHGHHFEPVDFVIDHGRGRHDAYSAGSCQRTYARACGCRQRPRRHREELIESERGWSGREAFVTMMQTADLGQGNDRSGPGRLNGSSIRCVLADRQVGP